MPFFKHTLLYVTLATYSLISAMEEPTKDKGPEAQQEEQRSRFKPHNEKAPEVSFKGNPSVAINNIRNPLINITDRLRTDGRSEKDQVMDAEQEGRLQALKQIEFKKTIQADLLSSETKKQQDALMQEEARKKIAAALIVKEEMNKAIPKEQKIKEAQEQVDIELKAQEYLEEAVIKPEAEQRKIDLAKQQARITAHSTLAVKEEANKLFPKQKKIDEAKEQIDIKLKAQEYLEEQIADRSMLNRQIVVAQNQAIAQAAASLAAKKFMLDNDPGQSTKAKFLTMLKEAALMLAANTIMQTGKLIGQVASEQIYQAYLNLPLDHCRKLKERYEQREKAISTQEAIKRAIEEKNQTQQIISQENVLIRTMWEHIQNIKQLTDNAKDEEQKKMYIEYSSFLEKQYLEAVANLQNHINLNRMNAPHMLKLEKMAALHEHLQQLMQQKGQSKQLKEQRTAAVQ